MIKHYWKASNFWWPTIRLRMDGNLTDCWEIRKSFSDTPYGPFKSADKRQTDYL